jgi:hypothetical protein
VYQPPPAAPLFAPLRLDAGEPAHSRSARWAPTQPVPLDLPNTMPLPRVSHTPPPPPPGFKVLRCSKRYAHDWRACPFAHPTENARRRDPREHRYSSIACPDYKQVGCCSLSIPMDGVGRAMC